MNGTSRIVIIENKRGLHARASAKFVRVASEYDVNITVAKDGMAVLGTSIMGLMMLAAARGDKICLRGEGDGAEAALDALENLINDKFGEE